MGARVFVGNLNPQTSRGEIERLFSRIGTVRSIYLPLDRQASRPRGFAFVDLVDTEAAERALRELDGAQLGGRRLRLSRAVERRPDQRRDGPRGPSDVTSIAAAEPDDTDWANDDPEIGPPRASGFLRRKGGKHGSDRRRRQGTRRFID